jgi:hypothetical protein
MGPPGKDTENFLPAIRILLDDRVTTQECDWKPFGPLATDRVARRAFNLPLSGEAQDLLFQGV